MESIPSLRTTDEKSFSEQVLVNVTTKRILNMIMYTDASPALICPEFGANIFLTIDVVLRAIFCPSKCEYLKDIFNYFDIFAIVPYWLWIGIYYMSKDGVDLRRDTVFIWIEMLRVLRVFRLFRVLSNLETMNTILLALKKSKKEFLLFGILILVTCSMYGSMLYYAEIMEDNIPTIPYGMWWSLVTMTTIGYGDFYPVTTVGYIIASLCAICGTLIVALPIPVIVSNFVDIYGSVESSRMLRKRDIELEENNDDPQVGLIMLTNQVLEEKTTELKWVNGREVCKEETVSADISHVNGIDIR